MKINGKDYNHDSLSLMDFLKDHQLDPKHVVVEINQEILNKAAFDHHVIQKDDVVEIVSFVGGG